jgi:hypothetical protein
MKSDQGIIVEASTMNFGVLILGLSLVGAFSLTAHAAEIPPASRTQPNIILILADDLGFSDLGCYGGEIATPNVDRLAQGGLRFRNAYNAAVCVATRGSLLTGLYPQQAGYQQRGGPLFTHLPTIADLPCRLSDLHLRQVASRYRRNENSTCPGVRSAVWDFRWREQLLQTPDHSPHARIPR